MERRELLLTSAGLVAGAGMAGNVASMEQDAIESAKAVMRDHDSKVARGDLVEIATNMADDIVLFAPGAELVQGIESFREFYQSILDMGSWEVRHDYSGADIEGSTVILYGVARGTLTTPETGTEPFANNFLLMLKPMAGRYKLWRGAFAPAP